MGWFDARCLFLAVSIVALSVQNLPQARFHWRVQLLFFRGNCSSCHCICIKNRLRRLYDPARLICFLQIGLSLLVLWHGVTFGDGGF